MYPIYERPDASFDYQDPDTFAEIINSQINDAAEQTGLVNQINDINSGNIYLPTEE